MTDLFESPDHLGPPSVTGERDSHGIRWTKHRPPRPYIYDLEAGKEVPWRRCTSYIDVLDDRSVLENWKQRIVIVGLTTDPHLIERTLSADPDDTDTMRQITEAAFESGDGYIKSRKGTDLHKLAEQVDHGAPMPSWASDADLDDMRAYWNTMRWLGLQVIDMERRVVVDSLKVTGTFDRTLLATKDIKGPLGDVMVPKGWKGTGDLKTGRVDWGMSKMGMQLAVYARGQFYDGHTQQRSPMTGIDPDVGLIIHLPQGEATCDVYRVDLQQGWEGVLLAEQVHAWRKRPIAFEKLT